jgi:hypothetical protein
MKIKLPLGAAAALAAAALGDVRINQDPPGRVTNETSLAINPVRPGNYVVAFNDQPYSGGPGLGVAHSLDFGVTWRHQNLPLPLGMVDAFDPVTAADTQGRLYVGHIATDGNLGGGSMLIVAQSLNSGQNWVMPIVVSFTVGQLNDKPHMVADTWAGSPYRDYVHVAWIRDFAVSGPYSDIFYSRAPGAPPFSPPQKISDWPSGTDMGNGPNVAVAPDGTVYVVWLEFPVTSGGQVPGALYLDRSTDGGLTWGADRLVQPILTLPNRLSNFGGQPDVVARSYPSMAVSPSNPQELYVVYAADPDLPYAGDEADVFFTRSPDGGLSWSPPLRVHPVSSGHQFEPWIAVHQDGSINVAWYEAPPNDLGPWWNVMLAGSKDGGLNFTAPIVVTDQPFPSPLDAWGNRWMGEYLGLAVDAGFVNLAFTSSATDPRGDVFFDRVSTALFVFRGDLNCDGLINNFDIDPFVLALSNPAGYAQQFPGCNRMNADIDRDGLVTNFDIDPFVACIAAGACP